MYKLLGWNYQQAVSPVADNTCTIEEFDISAIITGAPNIYLRLVSRDPIPAGSKWSSLTGEEWEVLGKQDSLYELEHKSGLINFKSSAMLKRNYKRVI